jgi:hypothetical protein
MQSNPSHTKDGRLENIARNGKRASSIEFSMKRERRKNVDSISVWHAHASHTEQRLV